MIFYFLTGDLRSGFVRGLLLVVTSFDLSVEISDPLLPPPDVESSAPLLMARELFMPVVRVLVSIFCENLGGFAAEPEFAAGFLLLKGYSSRCSSLKFDPMLIISTSLASPFFRSS